MSDAIEVVEGRRVQRHELHPDASVVAARLGYGDEARGVSVEPDVVIVHVLSKRKLRQVRHQIGD